VTDRQLSSILRTTSNRIITEIIMEAKSLTTSDRLVAGKTAFEEITGLPASALDGLADLAPNFGRFVMEWEFADVYGSSSLDLKTRETIMIAACAALGATAAPILKLRIGSALRAGVPVRKSSTSVFKLELQRVFRQLWLPFKRQVRCSPQSRIRAEAQAQGHA
jgi:4-carboxymuconolactone decarboxylase